MSLRRRQAVWEEAAADMIAADMMSAMGVRVGREETQLMGMMMMLTMYGSP